MYICGSLLVELRALPPPSLPPHLFSQCEAHGPPIGVGREKKTLGIISKGCFYQPRKESIRMIISNHFYLSSTSSALQGPVTQEVTQPYLATHYHLTPPLLLPHHHSTKQGLCHGSDHLTWSPSTITKHDHQVWSSSMITKYDHQLWSPSMTPRHDHQAWSPSTITKHDH